MLVSVRAWLNHLPIRMQEVAHQSQAHQFDLPEALAQNWGNIQFGIRELSTENGESTVSFCLGC